MDTTEIFVCPCPFTQWLYPCQLCLWGNTSQQPQPLRYKGFSASLARRRQWHPTPVFLPGKSHGQRSLEGCSPWGCWGSDTTKRLHFHYSFSCIWERNDNPLQCSSLENPRDRGAWWAAISGVAQSRTRLKQLSMQAYIGEGNGNPLQCSCLANLMDRGAWWAAVYGVAQSWIQLNQLSSNSSRKKQM